MKLRLTELTIEIDPKYIAAWKYHNLWKEKDISRIASETLPLSVRKFLTRKKQ